VSILFFFYIVSNRASIPTT